MQHSQGSEGPDGSEHPLAGRPQEADESGPDLEDLSDDELGLLSTPEGGAPNAAGGARADRARRSWIVKNSEQELPDSASPDSFGS